MFVGARYGAKGLPPTGGNPRAYFTKAKSDQKFGRPSRAFAALETALAAEPTNANFQQGLDEALDAVRYGRHYRNVITRRGRTLYPRADGRTPTPEPEPEEVALEKIAMDEDWRYLDVFDLFQPSIRLRNAIMSLDKDGDGEVDGKLTRQDRQLIISMLRRNDVAEKTVKAVESTLEASGAISTTSWEMLLKLCPEDSAVDWENVLRVLDLEQGYFKTVFRWYCVEGAVGMSEIDTMGKGQFDNFAKECRIRGGKIDGSLVGRIFIRSNHDNSHTVIENPTTREQLYHLQPGRAEWPGTKSNSEKHMNLPEFILGVIRLAVVKYADHGAMANMPVADRVKKLIDDHIKPQACCSTDADIVTTVLQTAEVQHVFGHYRQRMIDQYDALCVKNNKDGMDSKQAHTINMATYMELLLTKKLISPSFTVKDARIIYVKINLDDELFHQLNPDDSADGLTLEEWQEALARICLERISDAGIDATQQDALDPAEFARELDDFVANYILPPLKEGYVDPNAKEEVVLSKEEKLARKQEKILNSSDMASSVVSKFEKGMWADEQTFDHHADETYYPGEYAV